jgi:hypothetical protein
MINLATLKSPKRDRPLTFSIVGDGGMGKTSLAALFPRPVFVRAEDGTQSIVDRDDVAMFPVATCAQDVLEAVGSLIAEDHDFATVIVDSVTRYNIMVEAEVLASDPKAKGLNQAHGGYGNAYDLVSKAHAALRDACRVLSERKGMHVVFLAHAGTETIDPPDADPYIRYSIPIHKKSIPHYTNDVDVVAYIKQRTFTAGSGDRKKATTDGSRIVTCYPTPSHVSKNRLGIEVDLPFLKGENPFAAWLNAGKE